MSVIVVYAGFASEIAKTLACYVALLAVMMATARIMCNIMVAEAWLQETFNKLFSRIAAIILAGLSVQYVIGGLTAMALLLPLD